MSGARIAAGAAAAGAAAVQVGPGLTWWAPLRVRAWPRLAGLGDPGHVALTFDDGPDPAGTPAVLAALDRLGWTATFFVLGSQVRRAPRLLAELAAAGHEVGVHGDQHRYLIGRAPRAAYDDLARARDTVADTLGRPPVWFRPPYGVLSGPGWAAAHRLGLTTVLWSAWGRDWRADANPASVLDSLAAGRLDGGTVLLHDSDVTSAPGSWRVTAAALPRLADALAARGLAAGPLAAHRW